MRARKLFCRLSVAPLYRLKYFLMLPLGVAVSFGNRERELSVGLNALVHILKHRAEHTVSRGAVDYLMKLGIKLLKLLKIFLFYI